MTSFLRMESTEYSCISNDENDVMNELHSLFGPLTRQELLKIAELFEMQFELKVSHDEKKTMKPLIAWFSRNWNSIKPHLSNLYLYEVDDLDHILNE